VEIGEKLKYRRKEIGLTMLEVAKIAGVSEATVSRWESGDIVNMRRDKIVLLAKALQVSPSFIMEWEDDQNDNDVYQYGNIYPIETKKIPLLGEIACGEPIAAYEEVECYVELGTDVHADFCLRARGDSMINARIHNGDIVFIRKQPDVENGEIAAVVIEGDATLKRVYKKPYGLLLMAENPEFEPIMVTPEEYTDFRIVGKAVAFQSDVK